MDVVKKVLSKGPLYLALLSFHGEVFAQAAWSVESQTKTDVVIQPDSDLERARVTIKRRVETKEPTLRRESFAFDEALRYKRLKKTEELVAQLEKLIVSTGQSPRRGELQMRLAELYFERSRDMASQEGESWRKEVAKWEALAPEQRVRVSRPVLKTPKADVYRRQALNLYNDLEVRSRGADAGRSQMIQREEVLFYLGMTLVEVGEGRRAEKSLEELLKKYPSSPRTFAARLQLADLYFDKAAFNQAIPLYLRLGSQGSTEQIGQVRPYVFYKLAWSYFNTAAYDKAILAYLKTVEYSEQGGASSLNFQREAQRDLARTFALAGKYQEGIDYFRRQKDNDLLREHLRNSADLSAGRGQPAQALKYYADLIQGRPTAPEAREYAWARLEILEQSKNQQTWVNELRSVSTFFGADSDWIKAQPSSERADYVAEVVSLLRREAKAAHQLAQKSRQASRFQAARPYYELYFANVPKPNSDTKENVHEMKFYYAELLYRLKDFDRAEAMYADVGDGKYSANAAYARILTLREVVEKDKSKSRALNRATEDFMNKFPSDARGSELLYASAHASYGAGNKDDSRKALEELMKKYPTHETGLKSAERYLFLLEEEGDLDKAIKGVETLSKNTALMNAHGKTLAPRMASFRERASLKRIELMSESSTSALNKKAEAFYSLAPTLSRNLQETAYNNAHVYANKAQNKELSDKIGTDLVSRFPRSKISKSIHLEQGEHLARSGNWSQSLAAYDRFLAFGLNAVQKNEHETALWNKVLIQSHLENQVGIKIARKSNASQNLKNIWDEFLKTYPRSKFRGEILSFSAYENTVKETDLNKSFGLPALNSLERDTINTAKTLQTLRKTPRTARAAILKNWPANKAKDLPWEMKRVLAQWAFEGLDPDFNTYSRMSFNFDPKAFAKSLETRTKALENLEKKYLAVVTYGDGDTALKSLNRMALAYRGFAIDLAKAPLPPEDLRDFVKPYEIKSQQLLEDCLSKAIEFKIAGAGLNECRTQLMRVSPNSYVLTHETLLSPGFVIPPPVSKETQSKLWEIAERSLRAGREGEFFLALKVARGEMDAGRIPKTWEPYFANLEGLQAWSEGSNEWASKKYRESFEVSGSQYRDLRRIVAMNLAAIHLNLGDFKEATNLMEGLSMESAEAALLSGVAFVGQSKFSEGAKIFDEATSKFKGRHELLFHAALAWSKAGDKKKAIERMSKYISNVTPSSRDISRQLMSEWRG